MTRYSVNAMLTSILTSVVSQKKLYLPFVVS